jgi:hypothetical protein
MVVTSGNTALRRASVLCTKNLTVNTTCFNQSLTYYLHSTERHISASFDNCNYGIKFSVPSWRILKALSSRAFNLLHRFSSSR